MREGEREAGRRVGERGVRGAKGVGPIASRRWRTPWKKDREESGAGGKKRNDVARESERKR